MAKKKKKLIIKLLVVILLAIFSLFLFACIAFLIYFQDKFYPGVKIAHQDIGGKKFTEVQSKLNLDFENTLQKPLSFSYQDKSYTINLAAASPEIELENTLQQAFQFGRSNQPFYDLKEQLQALIWGVNFNPQVALQRQTALTSQISQINQAIKIDPQNAKLIVDEEVTITPSKSGQKLNEQLLLKQINEYLSLMSEPPQVLPIITDEANFTTKKAELAKIALDNIKKSPIKLYFENNSWTIDQLTLLVLLDQTGYITALTAHSEQTEKRELLISSYSEKEETVALNRSQLVAYLREISVKTDRPVQEARFIFDANTSRVKEFKPAIEGRSLDTEKTISLITQAIRLSSPTEIELPVNITRSKITTGDVNSFGIRELIGQGISHFEGSISNRIYNFTLAAERLNGALIAPGETFSFNDELGEVSQATGYKQAYVIKSGRTVLDDGGGVCQLSTTVFRAALNTGLPITERFAHAYRVGYYEQKFPPGLDATVFPPSVDLKFKNDTPSYILLQTRVEGLTLYVDFYGTADNRKVVLTTPKVTNVSPPPPELRQDDPTLPKGTVKQVDWPAYGANVSFDRTVTRNGEVIIQETWRSNFRPWQAVYLVGTKE